MPWSLILDGGGGVRGAHTTTPRVPRARGAGPAPSQRPETHQPEPRAGRGRRPGGAGRGRGEAAGERRRGPVARRARGRRSGARGGARAGAAGPRRAMGKRLCARPGTGRAAPGEREAAAPGVPRPAWPSVPPRGAQRGRRWGRGEGAGTQPGPRRPRPPPCAGGVRPAVGACSSKKGKTKSSGGQGLPGRLSRNSSRRLLTEIYQVLYGSVIPLPAVVSISSWSQLICCDSCPQQFLRAQPPAAPTPTVPAPASQNPPAPPRRGSGVRGARGALSTAAAVS